MISRPKRAVLTVAIWAAIVVVLGLVPTCASVGCFPAATRVAAPLVCPAETSHTEVTARWGGSSRGGKSLKWDLYCLDDHGHGYMPSTAKLFFSLLAMWSAIFGVLLLGRYGLTKFRAARGAGGSDA